MADIGTKATKMTVQEIVDGIIELIRNRVYLPGTPIREVELCQHFGVSRTPVREALRLLQNSNVVEYIPRCGVQVADMDQETLAHITKTRAVLEVLSTRQAAERITSEELDELLLINEQFCVASTSSEIQRLDRLLHMRIAEISGNPCVLYYLKNLTMRQTIIATIYERIPERQQHSYMEHKGILDALEIHDPELAAKQTDIHFYMSQVSLQKRLETYLQHRTE